MAAGRPGIDGRRYECHGNAQRQEETSDTVLHDAYLANDFLEEYLTLHRDVALTTHAVISARIPRDASIYAQPIA